MSELSMAALAVAQGEMARGVRGGLYPYGRFRSPDIDAYMTLAGMPPHPDVGAEGRPWCAAGVFACFVRAVRDVVSVDDTDTPAAVPQVPCPRTAGALHMWELSPLTARTQLPAPTDVFVLDHGKGRGHVGFVLNVSPDGKTITTIEPDTNAAGSTTGDAWGQHLWQPADGTRGRLVGYLAF